MRCSGGLSNWIGVKNVADENSKDSWANLVGWVSSAVCRLFIIADSTMSDYFFMMQYTANINGEEQPFSFLSVGTQCSVLCR